MNFRSKSCLIGNIVTVIVAGISVINAMMGVSGGQNLLSDSNHEDNKSVTAHIEGDLGEISIKSGIEEDQKKILAQDSRNGVLVDIIQVPYDSGSDNIPARKGDKEISLKKDFSDVEGSSGKRIGTRGLCGVCSNGWHETSFHWETKFNLDNPYERRVYRNDWSIRLPLNGGFRSPMRRSSYANDYDPFRPSPSFRSNRMKSGGFESYGNNNIAPSRVFDAVQDFIEDSRQLYVTFQCQPLIGKYVCKMQCKLRDERLTGICEFGLCECIFKWEKKMKKAMNRKFRAAIEGFDTDCTVYENAKHCKKFCKYLTPDKAFMGLCKDNHCQCVTYPKLPEEKKNACTKATQQLTKLLRR